MLNVEFPAWGVGCRVSGVGFGGLGFTFRAVRFGFRVQGLEMCRV